MYIYTANSMLINVDHVMDFHISQEQINIVNLIAKFRTGSNAIIGKYRTKEEAIRALDVIAEEIKKGSTIFNLN